MTISKALELLVYANDALVVKSFYGHVPKANKLTTVTEFSNILGSVKFYLKISSDYRLPASTTNFISYFILKRKFYNKYFIFRTDQEDITGQWLS